MRAISLWRAPPSAGSVSSLLLIGLLLFLDQRFLIGLFFGALGEIALTVEILLPVDKHLVDLGVVRQRMLVKEREVRIFAGLNRSDALVDRQLFRRIDGNRRQRFVLGQPAI